MEFPFNINNLLGSEISQIDRTLTPYRTSPANIRSYKNQLCQVIDQIGEASAKAQSLNGVITTGHKLQISDHHLYLMKDPEANDGKGAVVGLLKMGHKRLFIYDNHGAHHEMEPLCALDFYVHESRQRTGCGRRLFEAMLKEEGVKPHQIAIDRPSHKFLSFLQKHYNLKATVPQVNNFVVFDGFFRDKPANAILDRRKGHRKSPLHPYQRKGRPIGAELDVDRLSQMSESERPPSGSLLPQSQLEREKDVLNGVSVQRQKSQDSLSSGKFTNQDRGRPDSKAMGAHNSMYSRYGNPSPAPQQQGASMATKSPTDNLEKIDTGKKIIGGKDPPLLRRDGPSEDYLHLLGRDTYKAELYQDRRGHLVAAPSQPNPKAPSAAQKVDNGSSSNQGMFPQPSGDLHSSKARTLPSTWNVFGVPPNPRTQNPSRYHTRLW